MEKYCETNCAHWARIRIQNSGPGYGIIFADLQAYCENNRCFRLLSIQRRGLINKKYLSGSTSVFLLPAYDRWNISNLFSSLLFAMKNVYFDYFNFLKMIIHSFLLLPFKGDLLVETFLTVRRFSWQWAAFCQCWVTVRSQEAFFLRSLKPKDKVSDDLAKFDDGNVVIASDIQPNVVIAMTDLANCCHCSRFAAKVRHCRWHLFQMSSSQLT